MVAALGVEPRSSRLSGERSAWLELGGEENGNPPGSRTPQGWIWSPACALAREFLAVSPGFEPGHPLGEGEPAFQTGAMPFRSTHLGLVATCSGTAGPVPHAPARAPH